MKDSKKLGVPLCLKKFYKGEEIIEDCLAEKEKFEVKEF